MKRAQTRIIIAASVLMLIAGLLFQDDVSAQSCPQWIAKMVSVQGAVEVKKQGDTEWKETRLREEFCPGDMIRALGGSRAAVVLVNGVIIRLDEYSMITFKGVEGEGTSLIGILKGVANFFSRWPRALKVYTPFVNGTVEGTEFLVKVGNDRTIISVFEGRVEAHNEAGSVTLTDGKSAMAESGKAPVAYIVVRPRDAVQWALYYPAVIYGHPAELKESDPRYYTSRASSLLHAGRVEEARRDIEKALEMEPRNSEAFALESVIAVTQNQKENALDLAKQAVDADPHSAAALIALSFVQQASFDLKGAMKSLEEAVRVEPDNALAWARLAEIRMSFGELARALEAAKKAVELNPDIARTQTVLGFAYLTEVKIKQSEEAFEKAIELDNAAPLQRLGLGLAKIRGGHLVEGRKEIEIAVSLDPDNSLMRSYLGKAFYEEKREKMADDQYGTAEKFDPKDPTPFFYDAIKKQSINRPVEALDDMQKAIDLNDDRAVYRSKLLLDADLAARSASLARIYTDLGFQNRALVEGWQSVNTDPADFSGHRFLADAYATSPRQEIARVSELLQSQLLQPINITPVQPELAESNLFILNGAGPSDLSYNEFNPLFNRNMYALQLTGVAGGKGTLGDEVVVSAVQGKISLSAGQFHYETDGFRENNDQRQNIYDLFAQYELSPKTSVQAEFRHRDFDHGDLSLSFDLNRFDPGIREKDDIDSIRFGIRHSFSPGSDIIGSVIYRWFDFDWTDGLGLTEKGTDNGILAELQHLYRTERFNLISGIGHFDVSREIKDISYGETFSTDSSPRHTNLYLYSQINYPKQVTWTIGGSADFFKGQFVGFQTDRDQFNPKFGLTWNPLPGMTVRAAVFRTLKRSLLTDQTIEPTQVAGFNQYFDDTEGTRAWRYGVGIDQKLSRKLYAGAEISKRDLDMFGVVWNLITNVPSLTEASLHEKLGRAYVNYAPSHWLALSGEYQYERFERQEDFAIDNITRLNTHKLILGVGFFHPSGFTAQLKPAYVSQDGKFVEALSPFEARLVPKEDQFWVFDASIGYRLPKRLGLITIIMKNLFDKEFKFQDTDPSNPRVLPERLILAKLTLFFDNLDFKKLLRREGR